MLGPLRQRQPAGYDAHSPTNDLGVIHPDRRPLPLFPMHRRPRCRCSATSTRTSETASGATTASPTPSARALDWVAGTYLAIDQGPIVVMIENARTGLLWNLFMSCPEIRTGLRRLGFDSPHLAAPTS